MIHIRRAGTLDARAMADLLNEIIVLGGTTAFTREIDGQTIRNWMSQHTDGAAWHIAETETGTLLGFQYFKPNPKLPPQACDIATFVKVGETGLGIGSKLFETTRNSAVALGYAWINATIRADNSGGLTYYQSQGFEDYARDKDIALGNGMLVDRISKRYDLKK